MRDRLESCRVSETADQTFPDNASISDLESELQTDQSVLGSPFDHSTGTNKGPATFVIQASFIWFFSTPQLSYTSLVFGIILIVLLVLFWFIYFGMSDTDE